MTTAVRQPPNHDTLTCYIRYQCRRPKCVDRYNRNNQQRLRQHAQGTYDRLVDAAPVREHVKALVAAGGSARGISAVAGVNEKVVRDLLPPTKGGRRRPAKHRVLGDNARKVLAVRVEDVVPPSVNATGTVRRIQALIAVGWPMTRLAEPLGMSDNHVWDLLRRYGTNPELQVLGSTAHRVAAAYNTIRSQDPTRSGVALGRAAQAKRRAAARRWPTPKYWDQYPDAIDDPTFTPEYKKLRAQIIAEEAAWLMTIGNLDRDQAAARLGIARFTIDRALREHPQDALQQAA